MRITDVLLGEHGVFYAQFDYLERTVPGALSLPQVQAQAAMLAAALLPHAKVEDDILFAAVEQRLGEQAGPTTAMRSDHHYIESALERAAQAHSLSEAQEGLLRAIDIARDHFWKEEQIVFQLADNELGEDALNDLGAQWAAQRGVMAAA